MSIKKLTERELQILFLKAHHYVLSQRGWVRESVELGDHRVSLTRYNEYFQNRSGTVLIDSICIMGGNRRKFLCKRAVEDGEFLFTDCGSHSACRKLLNELTRYYILFELADL